MSQGTELDRALQNKTYGQRALNKYASELVNKKGVTDKEAVNAMIKTSELSGIGLIFGINILLKKNPASDLPNPLDTDLIDADS